MTSTLICPNNTLDNETQPIQPVINNAEIDSVDNQNRQLYDITNDEADHMQSLLNNIQHTPRYSLRSKTKFEWNSDMNEFPTVIEQEK